MARQIIILDRLPGPVPTFRVVYWLDVPVAVRPYLADPARTSQVVDATAGELTALRDGSVVEVVEVVANHPGRTLPQQLADLVARRAVLQAERDADRTYQRYGSYYDGTSWTAAGTGGA